MGQAMASIIAAPIWDITVGPDGAFMDRERAPADGPNGLDPDKTVPPRECVIARKRATARMSKHAAGQS